MDTILPDVVAMSGLGLDGSLSRPGVEVGVFHMSDADRKRRDKARKASKAAKAARKRNRRR